MLSTKRPPCLIDAEDQFVGVQEDSERDYMVETRGKDKTVMWLEVQPYGTPRQPKGPAQAPDPRLKEKGHKGSKSSKGSKAKEEGTNKQRTYAMRVLQAIETQQIRWFDLGVMLEAETEVLDSPGQKRQRDGGAAGREDPPAGGTCRNQCCECCGSPMEQN